MRAAGFTGYVCGIKGERVKGIVTRCTVMTLMMHL